MRTSIRKTLAATFLLAAVLLLSGIHANKAEAAYLKELQQTANSTGSISVQWDTYTGSSESILNYSIKVKPSYGNEEAKTVASNLSASTRSYTINGLKAGTRYNIIVTVKYRSYSGKETEASRTLTASTVVSKVTGLKQDRWYYFILSMTVVWDRQDAADGYQVEARKSNGKLFKRVENTGTGTSASFSGIKNEMIYTVRARVYQNVNGSKQYGAWSDPIYCFTQPRISSAKVKSGKLIVNWKKVSGATGYRIYVSTKPTKGYKKVKQVSKRAGSAKIARFKGKKFKANKKYYVYVQTLKKVNGKVSTSGRLYYWNTKDTRYGYF